MNLRHHGDSDTAPGLIDLAVNVRSPAPAWLLHALTHDPARWASYPDPRDAMAALANRHGVPPHYVLPVAGAAAAFTLVAESLRPTQPVVVHPQFTEPESALTDAGLPVTRHVLPAPALLLDPDKVPHGDLVVIGNPTNPTGTLHPAAAIRSLRRPDRIVVVDEAFMDFVPGEQESVLNGDDLTGMLVVRSLTKMWGIPGIRAGYVVGDPRLVEVLAHRQRPWATSTPALDALVVCNTPEALAEAGAAARQTDNDRALLCSALASVGFPVAGTPRTPFVLVPSTRLGRESIRPRLARHGFAVRRGETFPGLGPDWFRAAVRDEATSTALAEALAAIAQAAGSHPSTSG